jgi:4-hydroxybenzoate polyprenyltransferase
VALLVGYAVGMRLTRNLCRGIMWTGLLLVGLPVLLPRLAGGAELPSALKGLVVVGGVLLMFLALNLLNLLRKLSRPTE